MTHDSHIIREAERILREAREPQANPLRGLVNPEHGPRFHFKLHLPPGAVIDSMHITYDGTQDDPGDQHKE